MKHVICAECVKCKKKYEAAPNLTTCVCGGVTDILYDYEYIRFLLSKNALSDCRDMSMWRYRPFLPVEDATPAPPLRVGWSPLYDAGRLAREIGVKELKIKDDGLNPTSSLKDRASSVAVAKAFEAGAKTIACASTGNAASSLAGNAAAAGMKSVIFVPSRAPSGKIAQLLIFGAVVISVDGTYAECFRLSAEAVKKYGWYDRSAAVNPYLSEGKKTVSFEIAEQSGFAVPDYVAVSVGDGCTIAGIWKGFKDMFASGCIERLPRLISVQAEGCRPINRAAETGLPPEPSEENTTADSIAVGIPRNADKAINAIKEANGLTVDVSDGEISEAMKILGQTSGVFGEPAGVAGTAGLIKAAKNGLIEKNARVVSVVTGNGLKDTASALRAAGNPISIPPDTGALEKIFPIRDA
ncbi:MAG: threonine synthase [Oscillospiraceae bacterium]|nr:threonine synthase [Oscillospiraceae bacterium]